jgi:hypothetical protein
MIFLGLFYLPVWMHLGLNARESEEARVSCTRILYYGTE